MTVAIIRFRLVSSGSDNTELSSNHQSSVEGGLLLEDHRTASFDWPWGFSFQGTRALFLNCEFAAAPQWQQCR